MNQAMLSNMTNRELAIHVVVKGVQLEKEVEKEIIKRFTARETNHYPSDYATHYSNDRRTW